MKKITRTVLLTAILAAFGPQAHSADLLAPESAAAAKADFSRPLTLPAAEKLLLANNPDLVAARIGVDAAQADRLAADHSPNPNLSLAAVYYYPPYLSAPYSHYSVGGAMDNTIGISQLFERGDKRGLRVEAADKGIDAARADLKDMGRKLRLTLAQRYYGLAAAEQWEQIARTLVDLYGKSVDAMQLRLKAGDISATDLARMQVEAGQAEISLRRARNTRLQAQKDLAQILGAEGFNSAIVTAAGNELGNDISIRSPAKPDFAAIVDSRADVISAQARLDQAHASKKLALALNKNDVTVGLQYEHVPTGASISTHNVGINLSFPLQVLYQNQGEIAQAEAARELAVAQLGRTRAEALLDVQKSWSDLESTGAQLQNYQGEIVPRARQAAQAAEFAYQHGSGSLLDLLDARRTLYNLLLDAVNAHADYQVATWQWLSASDRQQ